MRQNAKIYVMQDSNGTIKLGHSKSPERRAKELGVPVTIVHQTDVVEFAEKIERLAHRVLALHGKHLRGEWFEASLQDAVQAIEIATQQAEGEQLPLGGNVSWQKRKPSKVTVTMRFDQWLLDAIDEYRNKQEVPPTRAAVMEAALAKFLASHGISKINS